MNSTIDIVYRSDIVDIFKHVLNNDVAQNIASYIKPYPIKESPIKSLQLYDKEFSLNVVNWSGTSVNGARYMEEYGYMYYKRARKRNFMVMNNIFPYSAVATPYLFVNMELRKIDIRREAKQNGIKMCKSWDKKKMVQHYYKSLN